MKKITLLAGLSSEFDWSLPKKEALESDGDRILWEFDFEFSASQLFLTDPIAFNAYALAIDFFCHDLWLPFSDQSSEVILYRGSLDILHRIVISTEQFDPLKSATFFGDFLQRLSLFLPEKAIPYSIFEAPSSFSPAETAQLLSKERFQHLQLSFDEENVLRKGLLLPPDHLWTEKIKKNLDIFLSKEHSIRVIPEKFLSEMWDELDQLIVIKEAVTSVGHRQLKGFEIAGGEILPLALI